MKKFKYRAVDSSDEVHTGLIEANDYEDFLRRIWKLRLYPIEVELAGATDDKLFHLKKLRGKLKHNKIEPYELPETQETISPKVKIDWNYLLVLILIFFLLAISSQVNL